jgi:hypothetical protein
MLTKEIQKNILPYQTPKRQKKSPLFSLKKSNKKNCLQSKEKKQKKVFFQKKLKRFHKSKINLDDISLETNSTTNTLEEENLFTNEEQFKYFKEIEFVMKDICEKGFYSVENLEKILLEKKIENNEIKKGNVKYFNQNYKNFFENISPNEKIKLILDIDETLVYSKVLQEIQDENLKNIGSYQNPEIQNLGQDEYLIQIFEKNQERYFLVRVKIRKGLTLFFKKLFPFCEFYINTMASKSYVLEILKILEKYYDVFIKEENVILTSPNRKKNLEEKIIKEENFLILDDNICAWEIGFIPSIIPVKKFNDLNLINPDIFYQYYLFSNKIYCFNESKGCFIEPTTKIPHCVEISNMEKNSKSQLNNITEIIIKSFLLKKILNIPIRHCLHFIQNAILKNCRIYYQGLEPSFVSEMISFLGGIVINDLNDIKNATHIIYNNNYFNTGENDINSFISKENKNLFYVDIKWIFDCFFKFKKCDEKEDEYKI